MAKGATLLFGILVTAIFAGCLGGDDPISEGTDAGALTRVQDRYLLPFNTTGPFSQVLTAGPYAILDALSIDLPVELPVDEGGAGFTGDARMHMGLFLPDVPVGTQVPVIADIGPYYEDGDVAATEPAERLGRFLIENLVPHGYAVAQVSVFGSGKSNHCMDLMGRAEQLGIDAAVTWLGTQEWSNGNVGLIGRSYDGSTPWQAAMFGNPHLKTIVPISGLIGMHDLMWRNGTAENRAPDMHNRVYGLFGIDSVSGVSTFSPASSQPQYEGLDAEDAHTMCADYLAGPANGYGAYATGDWVLPQFNSYWAERHFLTRALENYDGSVYFIHGLQDWNVDPHMAFPAHQQIVDKGLDIKGLYGQWAHMYPDRPMEHVGLPAGMGREASRDSPRFDWAQDLLEWFDHYLKQTGPKPALQVEVQDNAGAWRIEETYPPLDAAWHVLPLDSATPGQTDSVLIPSPPRPPSNVPVPMQMPSTMLTYTFPALSDSNDTRIAGLARLHLTVTPTGPGGQVFARLRDAETGQRLGHAVMDLRFAAGGREMRPVVPGQPLVAMMEFEAMDLVLPAGHGLLLELSDTGLDYRKSVVSDPVLIDTTAASVLKIPTIERGPDAFFTPVPWDACSYPRFVEVAAQDTNQASNLRERLEEYGCAAEATTEA